MWTKEQRKRHNARLAEAGICRRCGKNPVAESYTACQSCLDQKRLAQQDPEYKIRKACKDKRLRDEARAVGICTTCLKCKAITDRTECQNCIDKYTKKREFVYAAYGNKCSCSPCGETRWQFLTLDHINNDGAVHRKEIGSGSALIEWAIKNNCPPTLRLHCWNCNSGRERNNKICPHLTDGIKCQTAVPPQPG